MQQPPKRQKFRKSHKGRNRGLARNAGVSFGDYGIQSLGRARLNARQIESARRVLARSFKRTGQIWIRVYPDKPITKKPLEVRQGKGKGPVEYFAYLVKPGAIIFEVSGVSEEAAKEAFRLAIAKFPFKAKFVKRSVIGDEHESE